MPNATLVKESTEEELMYPGLYSCPGCMAALGLRHVLREMGSNTILIVASGCAAVIDGPFPYSSSRVPYLHGPFGTSASMATGARAAMDILGKEDVQVLAYAGDGGTFDIGLAAVSAAASRNDNMLYVCYDNEAYMNTGVQFSTATPPGAHTTTTVISTASGNSKKNITEIMASHEVPFVASASVGYPKDLIDKVRQAREITGFKFIHLHTPCPTGWWVSPDQAVHIARLAVRARLHPLYRVFDGQRYVIDFDPAPVPVREYFATQERRMRGLTDEDIASIQGDVERRWRRLLARTCES